MDSIDKPFLTFPSYFIAEFQFPTKAATPLINHKLWLPEDQVSWYRPFPLPINRNQILKVVPNDAMEHKLQHPLLSVYASYGFHRPSFPYSSLPSASKISKLFPQWTCQSSIPVKETTFKQHIVWKFREKTETKNSKNTKLNKTKFTNQQRETHELAPRPIIISNPGT